MHSTKVRLHSFGVGAGHHLLFHVMMDGVLIGQIVMVHHSHSQVGGLTIRQHAGCRNEECEKGVEVKQDKVEAIITCCYYSVGYQNQRVN